MDKVTKVLWLVIVLWVASLIKIPQQYNTLVCTYKGVDYFVADCLYYMLNRATLLSFAIVADLLKKSILSRAIVGIMIGEMVDEFGCFTSNPAITFALTATSYIWYSLILIWSIVKWKNKTT
jgi:hypothetical protein